MSYIDSDDMVEEFGEREMIERTDRSIPPGDVIDPQVMIKAINHACSFIDARLVGRYTLPLTIVPTIIKQIALDLARCRLYDDHQPDHIKDRCDEAKNLLKEISSGKLSLGVNVDGVQPDTGSGATIVHDGHIFSRKDNGFI